MIRAMQMPASAMVPAFKATLSPLLGSVLTTGLVITAGGLVGLAPMGARAQVGFPGPGAQPLQAGGTDSRVDGGPTGFQGTPAGQVNPAGEMSPLHQVEPSRQVTPVRWTSGAGTWSLQPEAIRRFVQTGVVSDRSLESAIARSGWSPEELRLGLAKSYGVDLVALARFLYSSDGQAFLRTQTRSYVPSSTRSSFAVEALRSAIIAAAAGGQISALSIMAHLPTDFSSVRVCGRYDGSQNVCAAGLCIGEDQCTSLLSWYVFLPACLQANQARQLDPAPLLPLGRKPSS